MVIKLVKIQKLSNVFYKIAVQKIDFFTKIKFKYSKKFKLSNTIKMLKRFFGQKVDDSKKIQTASTNIQEQIDLLHKKSDHLEKMVAKEQENAKKFVQAKNKNQAILCLKRKKRYEEQHAKIQNQIINLEETNFALQDQAMIQTHLQVMKNTKQAFQTLNVDKKRREIEDLTDEIQENMENVREISQILSEPLNSGHIDIDDELEELESLTLEEDLLKIPESKTEKPVEKNTEKDELEKLEKEMMAV